MCWLPGHILSRLGFPLHTIEICAPHRIRIEIRGNCPHRNCHLCDPDSRLLINMHGASQTALEVSEPRRRDVEVNPHSIRSNLEFFVEARLTGCGLQKSFSDIVVPEVIAPAVWVGVGEHKKLAITTDKSQVQSDGRPQYTDFGLERRIRTDALPVCRETNRTGCLPLNGRIRSVRYNLARDAPGDHFGLNGFCHAETPYCRKISLTARSG